MTCTVRLRHQTEEGLEIMIWELTAFEEGCLQKAVGREPKPSIKELSHLLQMKDETGEEAREERRRTGGQSVNRTSRTLQKKEEHSASY